MNTTIVGIIYFRINFNIIGYDTILLKQLGEVINYMMNIIL